MTFGSYLRLIFSSWPSVSIASCRFHAWHLRPALITHRLLFYFLRVSFFSSCRYIISIRLCTTTPHAATALANWKAKNRLCKCALGVNTSLHSSTHFINFSLSASCSSASFSQPRFIQTNLKYTFFFSYPTFMITFALQSLIPPVRSKNKVTRLAAFN